MIYLLMRRLHLLLLLQQSLQMRLLVSSFEIELIRTLETDLDRSDWSKRKSTNQISEFKKVRFFKVVISTLLIIFQMR